MEALSASDPVGPSVEKNPTPIDADLEITIDVSTYFPSLTVFRSSDALRTAVIRLLTEKKFMTMRTRSNRSHEIQCRTSNAIEFAVSSCCIPHVFALLGEGYSAPTSPIITAEKRKSLPNPSPPTSSTTTTSSSSSSSSGYEVAKTTMEEIIIFFQKSHLLFIQQGDDAALDDMRTAVVVRVLYYRRAPLVAFVRTVTSNLKHLLDTMSRHVLAVECLCPQVKTHIEAVTSKIKRDMMEHEAAGHKELLTHGIGAYFQWLRHRYHYLVPLCRVEEMLTRLDKDLRCQLHNEHYESPAQFLEVFKSKYCERLSHLQVPLLPWTAADYEQAEKDLIREQLILNKKKRIAGVDLRQELMTCLTPVLTSWLEALTSHMQHCSETTESLRLLATRSNNGNNNIRDMPCVTQLVDTIISHVIVVSSRTVSCGDMYFLVQDLFGGEGLMLVPSHPSSNLNNSNKIVMKPLY